MHIAKQIVVFSGVLIRDKKVLLAQRNEAECAGAHMKWELPGGKVHFGESPEDAVEREFLEETGIKVKVKMLLPMVLTNYWDYDWGQQQTLCLYFLCSFVSEQTRHKDHHIADVKWFSVREAKKLDSLPGTSEALSLAAKQV